MRKVQLLFAWGESPLEVQVDSPPNPTKEKWIDSNRLELAREIAHLTGDEMMYQL